MKKKTTQEPLTTAPNGEYTECRAAECSLCASVRREETRTRNIWRNHVVLKCDQPKSPISRRLCITVLNSVNVIPIMHLHSQKQINE